MTRSGCARAVRNCPWTRARACGAGSDAATLPVAARTRAPPTPRPLVGSNATSWDVGRGDGSKCAHASRSSWPRGASRRPRAAPATSRRSTASTWALAVLRRSRARNGILLAPDIEPGLIRCLAVRGGRALGWPACRGGGSLGGRRQRAARAGAPVRGGRGRLVGAVAARGRGRGRDDPDGGIRRPGHGCRPDRYDAADGCPRRAAADRRARARVPERAPVRREDRRDWRALQQVEPPTGLRFAAG